MDDIRNLITEQSFRCRGPPCFVHMEQQCQEAGRAARRAHHWRMPTGERAYGRNLYSCFILFGLISKSNLFWRIYALRSKLFQELSNDSCRNTLQLKAFCHRTRFLKHDFHLCPFQAVAKIHSLTYKKVRSVFLSGIIKRWPRDPYSLGAFVLGRPYHVRF